MKLPNTTEQEQTPQIIQATSANRNQADKNVTQKAVAPKILPGP
jgi:hypothetical protein